MTPNLSSSFRVALQQELPAWLQEGIVTEDAAQRLTALYDLDNLRKESSSLLAAVIFTLGGLLLGGGLLSFVAANWEEIPTLAKVVLLIVLLLAFHGAGYWLWHHKNWPRLGHALVFTGSLVFGANIGLMAQIFHVSGEWYGAFGAWALGSLVMAYAARSWITGLLALVTSITWFQGISQAHLSVWMMVVPLLLAALFLLLAWQLRSRVLYVATYAGLTWMLCSLAAERYSSGKYVLATMIVGGFAAWAAGECHRVQNVRPEFGNPTAALGILILGSSAYIWSFHWWWELHNWATRSGNTDAPKLYWIIPTLLVALLGLALAGLLLRQSNTSGSRKFLIFGISIASAILILCALIGGANRGDMVLLTISVNLAALIIAVVAIAIGVIDERRLAFWTGTLFVVLLIISRFLEYETSLLTKSAAFTVCGVAMIAAGIAYENHLRRKEALI
ncbi:MAG TPA: DUF2157 domain-containing protein [Blastocatellia bacterium]|nr:DUF2157 domain-containing protein [Blastocatellia bacterium]